MNTRLSPHLRFLISNAAGLLLLACAMPAAHAGNPVSVDEDSFSLVKMKMTESLNSMIDQGIATMNNMKRAISSEPAAPAVTRLKMDKINSRFVENNDEIYDRTNNITWSRCSLGQRWVKTQGCIGTVRQVAFDQAFRYTNSQWRLPTRAELASLIDHTKKTMPTVLAIDSVAFPDMDLNKLYYWTGTEEDNSFAWAVLFVDSGIPSVLYRSHRYAVRLVRDGA